MGKLKPPPCEDVFKVLNFHVKTVFNEYFQRWPGYVNENVIRSNSTP